MNYLIPSNTKKGALIFSLFRPIDLIIFGSGIGLTIMLLLIFSADGTVSTLLLLIPLVVSGILIAPIPNYHNVLVVLQEIIEFLSTRQRMVWKGWCAQEDGEGTKK